MELKQTPYDVGVIVGRFQVHYLHPGHVDLIRSVLKRHKKVVMVLGVAPVPNSTKNPLDYEARAQMVKSMFDEITTIPLADTRDDTDWSLALDRALSLVVSPTQSAVLYGGRDSFISVYAGRYPTQELVQEGYVSGTDVRQEVRRQALPNENFRAGVIWASANRFPTVYTTVDIVIFSRDFDRLLLCQKPDEFDRWRMVGGFADPRSNTFEEDAAREVLEETNLVATEFHYLSSHLIDDWRYRGEADKIKTLLFAAQVDHELAVASDDIARVRWFQTAMMQHEVDKLVYSHHAPLVKKAIEFALIEADRKKVGSDR